MRIQFLIAALLGLAFSASAQETLMREVFDTKTDTHVELVALFTQPPRGGYLPVRVKIANNLDSPRTIRLRFESSPGYFSNRLQMRSGFEFAAGPRSTLVRDIMVPVSPVPQRHVDEITVDVIMNSSEGESRASIQGNTPNGLPSVLISQALHAPNASALDSEIRGMGSSRGSGVFAGKYDPKQLPDDWLAFSGYDCMILTDSDWSEIPAGPRNAILSWMKLGGRLLVFPIGHQPNLAALGIPVDQGFGSCEVRNQVGPDLKLLPSQVVALTSSTSNPVRHLHEATQEDFSRSNWPLQDRFGTEFFEYGLLVAVLIIFSILVGPVNLFVFARGGKRHRLFWTTPLISLVASLGLIAMIVFQDGFGGEGARRVLMEVDSDAGGNAAYVHQEQFSRSGILTRSGFTVDPKCLMLPVPIAESRWARFTNNYNTSGSFVLRPMGGKLEASGDWWQSRSEHGHLLSAVVSTRGRIEKTDSPDTLVSSFDFPIETLYYLDDSKQWHRAEGVTTGKPFRLTPVEDALAKPVLSREAGQFSARYDGMLNRAMRRPGHFVAITTKAPGIGTLPGIRWRETRTVITGKIR
jgi:hypothetical protein